MEKFLAGFLVGIIFGLIFGAIDWKKAFNPFSTAKWGIASPKMEHNISRFHTKCPQFSSDHFYFFNGGPDAEEYWSFVLPPEYARVFLDSYIRSNSLPAMSPDVKLSEYVCTPRDHKDWRSDLWFKSVADFSEAYFKKGLFCGYSAEQNRIYLMNWHD
jgi:hypothetical protein